MPQTLTDKIVAEIIKAFNESDQLDGLQLTGYFEHTIETAIDKVIGEQVKIDERNMNNFRSFLKGYFDDQGRVDDIELGFNLAFYNPPKTADDGK